MAISDKLIIQKIIGQSGGIETVASGFNQVNEYTQGGGSDSFTQYSQDVENTLIQDAVQTPLIKRARRTFKLQNELQERQFRGGVRGRGIESLPPPVNPDPEPPALPKTEN